MKNKKRSKFTVHAKKATKESGGSRTLKLPNGVQLFKIDENAKKAILDILPYVVTSSTHLDKDNGAEKGEIWYRRPYLVHNNIGADNKSFICLKSIGKKCPICEFQTELFKTDKEAAIKLYAKRRNLFIVNPKNSKKFEEGTFYVWDMAESLFHDVLVDTLEEDDSNNDFADLEEGKTLELSLKWKTLGDSTFPETRNINFVEREEGYDESILDDMPNLDDCLNVLSYDELNNIFMGLGDDDVEEDDEEEKPRTKKSSDPVKEEKTEWSWKQLEKLNESKLTKLIDQEELDVDVDDYDDENDLRIAVAKELGVKVQKHPFRDKDDEDEDEEDVDEQPKKPTRPVGKTVRKAPVKEDDEDEEPEEKPKAKTTRTTSAPKIVASGGKGKETKKECPHGHVFGKDCEAFKHCNTCDLWDDCLEEQEKLSRKK